MHYNIKFYVKGDCKKMTSKELETITHLLQEGKITQKEAVNHITTFVIKNYPVFGLHKYDEDFRSEIQLLLLERGVNFLASYNSELSDFFTYLYCYVLNLIHTKKRNLAKSFIKENLTVSEGADYINELKHQYTIINYNNFEKPKIPYSFNTIKPEYLKEIFSPLSNDNCDKKILVLALKSCFFLTDEHIAHISRIYKISPDDLYMAVQYCKDSVLKKAENHDRAIERRNFAYYHHKKYDYQLERMKQRNESYKSEQFMRKYNKYMKSWINLNQRFHEGYLILRPTSKTIAEILGISERLVSYYIARAKHEQSH